MLNKFASGTPKPDRRKYAPLPEFLEQVWLGNAVIVRAYLDNESGRHNFLNEVDPVTGMNALHIAVGRDNLEIAKVLIEAGIAIIPDKEGRMPSLIAGICRVSDEVADAIYEAERRVPQAPAPEDV
jgi:ankyrin repeat protein